MSHQSHTDRESLSDKYLAAHQLAIWKRTDKLFVMLLSIQWVAGIVAAALISPRSWSGAESWLHIHVPAAIILGGLISCLPIYLGLRHPGRRSTRHIIAIAQMLTSALLIHLTGGRIETHFHVFGSLAFLACYRDWRVLITASVVVAADHWIRGVFWPESVYGILTASSWRFLEHAGWVVFEDVFLLITIRQSLQEMRNISWQRAELEATNERIDAEVRQRTTELKEALAAHAETNRQLEAAVEELQSKNRELDEFSYVASHDLQEPIRKMISFSQLLQQDVEGQLNEQAQRDIDFIIDAASRMRNLVQALLALSRAGRSAMQPELLDIDECVDRALDALEVRLRETGAEIERDPLPQIIGDRTMITQLYQNLLSNAMKFIDQESPLIRVTAESKGEDLILGVKDNGIGIKKEFFDKIFQPMKRLHGRSEYEGSGIGLAVCRKTVQRHAGTIWVESEPGAGAHFKFTLNAGLAPGLENEAANQPQQHGDSHTEILLTV